MDLTYSEEQILLKESANRFLTDRGTGAHGLWPRFAELGWLALPFPEEYGGLGGGAIEVAIVAEALGRHLVREPFVPTVVLSGGLVATAGSAQQHDALLPSLASGQTKLTLAHSEKRARNALSHVATTARRQGKGFILDGEKEAILGEAGADMLVSARLHGDVRDRDGIGLFVVPRDTHGLRVEAYPTVDGTGAAMAVLSGLAVGDDALLGGHDDALPFLEAAVDAAIVAWSWELIGIMEALIAATVDYTKARVQFGRPLATNQVLRHRMVDMSVACEDSRSAALRASLLLGDSDGHVRARAASAAKTKVTRAARFVAEQAVQTHGAMGVTDELAIGAYLKRVIGLEPLFGSPDFHLRRFAELSASARSPSH